MRPTSSEQKLQEADATRIGADAEAVVAEVDQNRIITTQRGHQLSQIAGDLPDDAKALWLYAERSLTQSAVSMIDAGRAFIKLKEIVAHGEFSEGLKARGISPRSAQQIMSGARRFADRSDKFLKLGRSKLYACLEFSDDELDMLEEGQSVLDTDLDELDRMTSRELKALIKKRDADIDVKNTLLEAKNKQIDDVAAENAGLRGDIKGGATNPSLQEIESEKAQIIIPLMRLKNRAAALETNAQGGAINRAEWFALQSACDVIRNELAQALDALDASGGDFQFAMANAAMPTDDAS